MNDDVLDCADEDQYGVGDVDRRNGDEDRVADADNASADEIRHCQGLHHERDDVFACFDVGWRNTMSKRLTTAVSTATDHRCKRFNESNNVNIAAAY